MFKGNASPSATVDFLKHKEIHESRIRSFCGASVSNLALGTYLGAMDEVTDQKVTLACVRAVEMGCNFFDSAINYRGQRAERSIGEAIRRLILSGKIKREELFISTKGGFVPYDGQPEKDIREFFETQYVKKNLARLSDLIADCHCMEPTFISDQIDRSRKNLGLETIDLYYLHNPETQLEELPERLFLENLERAFVALEQAVQDGKIMSYGLATWNGFRDEPTSQFSLQIEKCVQAAKKAATQMGIKEHHFKAIQLPLSLAMPEAALLKTQKFGSQMLAAIEAADALGIQVAVSAPLLQSRLCHGLPDFILNEFPKNWSQAHCALGFSTGFSAVDAAMVGMKSIDHVEHNLSILKEPCLNEDEVIKVVNSMLEKNK